MFSYSFNLLIYDVAELNSKCVCAALATTTITRTTTTCLTQCVHINKCIGALVVQRATRDVRATYATARVW